MTDKLTYQQEAWVPKGPNQGYLYTTYSMRDEGLIGNSHTKHASTGLRITVPAGATVKVRGLFENEAIGLNVVPMDIDGPVNDYALTVVMRNNATATHKLDKGRPIATIAAIATPKPRIWHEDEKDLVGDAA